MGGASGWSATSSGGVSWVSSTISWLGSKIHISKLSFVIVVIVFEYRGGVGCQLLSFRESGPTVAVQVPAALFFFGACKSEDKGVHGSNIISILSFCTEVILLVIPPPISRFWKWGRSECQEPLERPRAEHIIGVSSMM